MQFLAVKLNWAQDIACVNFDKFRTLLMKLQNLYRDANPYHTAMHAADVVQSQYLYMTVGNAA